MDHTPLPQRPPLPDAEALLGLERRCRYEGTGLEADKLFGAWQLQQTWSKGQAQPAATSSWLLRALAAQLRIEAGPGLGQLRLSNRVSLGSLSLQFTGQGQLQGRRPLLVFWFERVQLLLGPMSLLDQALAKPAEAKLPFCPDWPGIRGRSARPRRQAVAGSAWPRRRSGPLVLASPRT
jgi:hypothetical protein